MHFNFNQHGCTDMTIHIHHPSLVTVADRFRRRQFSAYRRGAVWFADGGRVSARVQRAIEAEFSKENHARS